jgi:hypothetical protein
MRSLCLVGLLIGQAVCSPATAQPSGEEETLRRRRMELLESVAADFEIRKNEEGVEPLARSKAPILRWSNPVRDFVNDGLVFLWLDGKRPEAAVTVWARSLEADLRQGELWRECVTLSARPLVLRREEQLLWSPQPAAVVNQPLPDADAPQATPSRRLIQMREIARSFQATTYKMEAPHELRLLPRPLYRYSDEEAGVLDGAMFAFVEGNDAEALLLLEAATDSGRIPAAWRFTLGRMTSYRVVIRRDDREIFDVAPYWKAPRSPNDPYVEAKDRPFSLGQEEESR